jgi:hypothetical protein
MSTKSFSIVLANPGSKLIEVIMEVRRFSDLAQPPELICDPLA